MILQSTQKQKQVSSLHEKKNKLNYRSLSLFDNKKINLSPNINFRLKTQSQQLQTQRNQKSNKKLSLLLNSFQQSKIKQVRTKRYESIQSLTQNFFIQDHIEQQLKLDKKNQNQWVNSILPTMSAEALHQENQQLKKQSNFLKQQNSKLSSKLVFERKEKQKLAKQLSLENQYFNLYERFDLFDSKSFGNEKSNTKPKAKINNQNGFHPVNYMITGIKFRYEKLKNDYELKCKHIEEIMKLTNYTQIQQTNKENQILKQENKKLLQTLIGLDSKNSLDQKSKNQIIYNADNGFRSYNLQNISQISPRKLTTLIQAKNELQNNNKKLTQQNLTLKRKISNLEEQLHQKTSSIKNLHKSLTFIDNQLYYKKKQNSKLKKVQKQIEFKLLSLEKQNINIKKKCQQEIEYVRKINEQIFFKEKQIFLKEIEEKNEKITKIEKQVSYLSTLLKYWKPLQKDQKSSIRPLSSSKIDYQQFDESGNIRTSLLLVSNRKRTKTKNSQNDKSAQDLKLNLKEPVLSLKPSEFQDVRISLSDDQEQQITLRVPKTSRQKHSDKGFKAKKITPLQIDYMKQQLRYRCMAKRLTIDQIRRYFNFNPQKNQTLKKSQSSWKQKYATMKELQQILIQAPFILTKQQAFKFSRFIVEDTSAQHVFCDENNQIQRDIVKSIIQAFLGDYQLPDIQHCKVQLNLILKNYGVNLGRALDALCQNQIVSPKKLFELMESLGIEVSQELRNQIVCRLYEKSNSRDINCLRYQMIFQEKFI